MLEKMQKQPKIIICTEKGKLEKYSILLCRSIRKYGGIFSDAEIFSFSPRKGFEPSEATLKEFKKLNVKYDNTVLNTKYRAYPLANKPIVCAHFEEKYPNNTVVFIDSDQIVFNEPLQFYLPENTDLLIRPVDRRGVGFSSKQDSEYNYWQNISKKIGFDFNLESKVETSIGETIHPYFNSGLIITKTSLGLFKQWKENFELIFQSNIRPENGDFFLEQSVFSATVLQMKLNYSLVDNSYNYPFSIHDEIIKKKQLNSLSDMVTAHYHNMLVNKAKPSYLSFFLEDTEKGIWLKKQISELEIKPDTQFSKLLQKVKRKMLK